MLGPVFGGDPPLSPGGTQQDSPQHGSEFQEHLDTKKLKTSSNKNVSTHVPKDNTDSHHKVDTHVHRQKHGQNGTYSYRGTRLSHRKE